jgi:hypothetical protein
MADGARRPWNEVARRAYRRVSIRHRSTQPDREEPPLSQALTPRLATAAAVRLLSACVSVMPVPDVPQRRHREPAAEPDRAAHRSTSLTICGSGLDWHDVGAYMKPDAIGRYSFVGDNEIRFNPPGRRFDAALLMDCSQRPVNPQLRPIFFEFAKKHSDTLRCHRVEPMLLMTWADQDKPEMTQGLADAYTEAGRLNRAHVVPAGLAFARSIQARPDMNLYVADKRHPSPAGTYLTACTVLASVYGVSPFGNPCTAGLDPAVPRHLQQTAWDTVQAYRR